MGAASFVQSSFQGGAWSQTAQGRIDDPHYKTALSICLNSYPMEPGGWTRRSGTKYAAHTRGGAAGRVITWSFQQNSPYTLEFTDGHLRFFAGPALATTNDKKTVSSISTANPAKVATSAAHGWSNLSTVMFADLGANNPLLLNRQFIATVTSTTEFTLTDALTGATIDGSTLGTFVSGSIVRVHELITGYVSSLNTTWASLRMVQAEQQAVLLQGYVAPQVLSIATPPTTTATATFAINPAQFVDGPYLDPVPGAIITPSGLTGLISLTLAYQVWSTSRAYSSGDYVTYSGQTYKSLISTNVANQPDTATTAWVAVAAASAIGPNGFVSTDIGRHLRLFSEPPDWLAATTYGSGGTNIVKYAGVYWTSIATSNVNFPPNVSPTKWALNAAASVWSWGKVTSITGATATPIAGATGTAFGDMTAQGGLAAAFNGTTSQNDSASAATSSGQASAYVGKHYSAAAQHIAYANYYSSNVSGTNFASPSLGIKVTINLRAKQTAPSSSSDGTLLGTSGLISNFITGPIQVNSNDQTTAWNYVWFEIVPTGACVLACAQAVFYNLVASAGTGCQIQLIGPDLLYTTALPTWRLGMFNNIDNFPTCGTYHEGRLWFSGSISNRFDASAIVDISGVPVANHFFTFTPTIKDGTVTDSCAINYTLDGPDVNAIFWMQPDAQGIICGTQAGEWLIRASDNNNILTPVSIQAHRVTTIGCANIEPRRTDHTLVIAHKHQRKLVEYFADVFSGKFTAPNLAEKAKHLTAPGIAEIAYQQELTPNIWVRRTDGVLVGMAYKRDTLMTSQGPTFAGWHEHTLGSGRTVESICVGPNHDGTLDNLAMITTDASNVRHVEFMTDEFEEGNDLTAAWFLDDACSAASYSVATVMGGASGITASGFWHLNGKTVTVFAGGLDLGEWAVTNGSVSIPFNSNPLFTSAFVSAYSGAMPIIAGFTYASRGQLLPPSGPESGARNGPSFGKLRRINKYAVQLVQAQKIKFGTSLDKLRMAILRSPGRTNAIADNVLYTGTVKDNIDDTGQDFSSQLTWESTRPFPATIAAIGGFIRTEDE